MDKILLFGFVVSAFVAPFLSETGKILARRLFSQTKKSLPNPSTNVEVAIFVFVL